MQRLKKQVKPSADWGPALDQHRELYIRSLKGKGDNVLPELTDKLNDTGVKKRGLSVDIEKQIDL